jgi:deoxyribonuclease-4
MRIGAHLSISGGFAAMAGRARAMGCEAVQVFSRSPRGGPAKPISATDAAAMKATFGEAGIGPLIVHAPYYAIPASEREELGELAVEIIAEDCRRAAALGAGYVVVHGGSSRDPEPAAGLGAVVARVTAAARAAGPLVDAAGVRVVLENGGTRTDALHDLSDWAAALDLLENSGVAAGACLDVAHLWAAGHDLSPRGLAALLRRLEDLGVLSRLRVVHLNDSSAEHGSMLDRHEHIGQGLLPPELFAQLLTEPRLEGVAGIVETDGRPEDVARDLRLLKELRSSGAGRAGGGASGAPRAEEGAPR